MTMQFNLYEATACDGDTLIHKGGYSSVAECQAWCQRRSDCGAFTYNADRGRCYLKSDCDDRKIEDEDVSGVRLAVGALVGLAQRCISGARMGREELRSCCEATC